MRIVLYILQKEFIQVFRDKAMLPMIVIIPIVQLLVLSYAATFEIKNVRFAVVDNDRSGASRRLIARFEGSPFFTLEGKADNAKEAKKMIDKGWIDQVLVIEPGFSKNITNKKSASVQMITDAINANAASLMNGYAANIVMAFNKDIIAKRVPDQSIEIPIRTDPLYRFNPELNYITFMVPGILVMLVTLIGSILTAMNIVKEKELGTIEQLNVTPLNRFHFIAGKLIPFWIIAMIDLLIGLLLARFVFGISIEGSVPLLLGVASVYLVVVLSIGLLVSTVTETMQQAMFISYFVFVIFILLSGLFTPIESMPVWAQYLDYLNPLAYFIKINRMIMLKGSGFTDFAREFYILVFFAVSLLTFATIQHRKTTK